MKRYLALLLCLSICLTTCLSFVSAAPSVDDAFVEGLAQDLKSLGLFQGVSDTNFDLNRAPTRTEALVMLVRVLGKESEALSGTYSHPFTDVAPWADAYVGYAYKNGLTKGVSNTKFGTDNATCAQYVTFVLRALGYSDAAGDFQWDKPWKKAQEARILPGFVSESNFLRRDVVIISYAALASTLKDSQTTLAQKLISAGVFTQTLFDSVYRPTAIAEAMVQRPMTSEEIYAQCSPAVFYIEVADAAGRVFASGSGFFLRSDGTAVTNYHVIEGAHSATITTSDTQKTYKVTGVWDYNTTRDWAVIQVDGTGFPCLSSVTADSVSGGEKVYAIGSPLGLQNSITEGIISNTYRKVNGVRYFQTSAAISSGSSGGALINEFGQAVGITTGAFEEGQNLNLALPVETVHSHKHTTLTPLAQVAAKEAAAKASMTRSELVAALQNWLGYAKNDKMGERDAWTKVGETNGDTWSVSLLALESTSVTMRMDYYFKENGHRSVTYLTIAASEKVCLVNYYYYEPGAADLKATGIVNPASYVKKAPVTFASYNGPQADLQYHQEDAGSSVDAIVYYLNAILTSSPTMFNGADITNLGFPAIQQ